MTDDLARTIDLLVQRGPDLQRAGYQSITIGAVSFTLHQPEPDYASIPVSKPEPVVDALNDPTTYGLSPGDKAPGFTDPRKKKG